MSAFAVASPTAPLVSRVLAGRVLGGALGEVLVFPALAAGVAIATALVLAASGFGDRVVLGSSFLVTLVYFAFFLPVLPALYSRLPGVVAVAGDDLVDVLDFLRRRGTPEGRGLLARLVEEYEGPSRAPWFDTDEHPTGELVLLALSRSSGEDPGFVDSVVAAVFHSPNISPWDPSTPTEHVLAYFRAHRGTLAWTLDRLYATRSES